MPRDFAASQPLPYWGLYTPRLKLHAHFFGKYSFDIRLHAKLMHHLMFLPIINILTLEKLFRRDAYTSLRLLAPLLLKGYYILLYY